MVDDHSDSDLDLFRKKYPGVQFLQNSENRGACYARNRGFMLSTGDFINFLDDDDLLFSEKIDLQIKKFQDSDDTNLGMVTCHLLDCRSGKEIMVENRVRGDIYRDLLAGFAVSGTETMLFKRSIFDKIDGFDESLQSSQEYDLFIRASEICNIDYVDQALSQKNRSKDQISMNFNKKMSGAKYLFKKHKSRYRQVGFLFWLKMRLKLYGLMYRFMIGKLFGEKAYRFTIKN